MSQTKTVLAVETSCDETAAAIIRGGPHNQLEILSNIISSQIPLHQQTHGVVPEVAARAQIEAILPVIDQALHAAFNPSADWQFGHGQPYLKQIDTLAVTEGPGLIGSLLVGTTVTAALALALQKPLLPINHYEGHLLSFLANQSAIQWPVLTLTASGGHTSLYLVSAPGDYQQISQTRDDAAGEAFDKAASQLGLPYPGGPSLSATAEDGDPAAYRLPRPMLQTDSLDFSFSGLKTALHLLLPNLRTSLTDPERSNLAASFQAAVVDTLLGQLKRAITLTSPNSIAIVGGVSNNHSLQVKAKQLAAELNLPLYLPPTDLTTDNAAMIGIAALYHAEPSRWPIPTAKLPLS